MDQIEDVVASILEAIANLRSRLPELDPLERLKLRALERNLRGLSAALPPKRFH